MKWFHKIVGRITGNNQNTTPENHEHEPIYLNNLGDKRCAQGLPELAELVRLGDSWQAKSATLTGVSVFPTTSALWGLRNNEPEDGKSYIIDSVCVMKRLIDVTTNDTFSVFLQLMRPPGTAVTGALSVFSLSGIQNYGGRITQSTGVTMVSGRWDYIGSSCPSANDIAGSAWACIDIPLYGRYLMTPQSTLGFSLLEVTATANDFQMCVRWHEVPLRYMS